MLLSQRGRHCADELPMAELMGMPKRRRRVGIGAGATADGDTRAGASEGAGMGSGAGAGTGTGGDATPTSLQESSFFGSPTALSRLFSKVSKALGWPIWSPPI